jgi:hypothetical protein
MQTRHILMSVALMATLAAVYFAPTDEDAVIVQAAMREPSRSVPMATTGIAVTPQKGVSDVALLKPRTGFGETEFNLFSPDSWDPPASKDVKVPVKAEPEAIPEPVAPSAPIKLLGRYEETDEGGAKVAVFATFHEQNVVLRAGEVVGTEWRVEAIEANQVVLIYLPLGHKQNLLWAAP